MISHLHEFLDGRIYFAYELGIALVTAEEEVQQNLRKSIESRDAFDVRKRSARSRLFVLGQLFDIQTKYPGIVVAFQSRQASQMILNEITAQLANKAREGHIDDPEWAVLQPTISRYHQRIIDAPGSLPASYKPIAMLRVIPWIATDSQQIGGSGGVKDARSDAIRQFLAIKIRPVQFAPGDVIVHKLEEHPIIMTYSGILRIEGEYVDKGDGVLPNSSSWLFFYNEGEFSDYVFSPTFIGELGLVSNQKTITKVTAETPINAYVIPRQRVVEAIQRFSKPPSLLYQIWCHIARTLSIMIMQLEARYQTWPIERISIRLETFTLPDFERSSKFILTPEVEDAILIQVRE